MTDSPQEQEVKSLIYDFFSMLMETYNFKLEFERECKDCDCGPDPCGLCDNDEHRLRLVKRDKTQTRYMTIDVLGAIKKGNKNDS